MYTAANGDRPGVPNVAIVITDGVSNINSRRTIPEAEQARAAGIHIYAIGIGLTDTTELGGIASKPVDENLFSVKEFSELRNLRSKVFSALCKRRCFYALPVSRIKQQSTHLIRIVGTILFLPDQVLCYKMLQPYITKHEMECMVFASGSGNTDSVCKRSTGKATHDGR